MWSRSTKRSKYVVKINDAQGEIEAVILEGWTRHWCINIKISCSNEENAQVTMVNNFVMVRSVATFTVAVPRSIKILVWILELQ